jgi:hypothetical protein
MNKNKRLNAGTKYGRRKGGNYPTVLQLQQGMQAYNTYANQPAQQPQQPQGQPQQPQGQPQQPQGQPLAPPVAGQPVAGQQGFIGTALTDLKNNKDMFQPVYDTTSSIGLVYNFVVALFATLLAALLIFVGYMVKDYYIKYSGRVRGRIVSAKCYTEMNSNKQRQKKCDATVEYEVAGKKYNNSYLADEQVNVNQGVDINYDPLNPNNFTTKYDLMSYIGWGFIIFAAVMLFVSWGWFILSWMFKPIAAASGIGAIGSALTPNN